MKEIRITNMAKFYCMLLLCDGPKHGYELIKETSERLESRVSPGQIYPFLARLEKAKYIRVKSEGAREKKVYVLTPEGKAFCKSMLHRFGGLIDLAVEPKLSQCAHCGCMVYEGGHTEKINGKTLKFCCRHCARTFRGGTHH